MLDDASLGFLGMPFAETIMVTLGLMLFAAAAWSATRALDSLCAWIRAKRPDLWENAGPYARLYRGGPPFFHDRWMAVAVLGLIRLDIPTPITARCYGGRERA